MPYTAALIDKMKLLLSNFLQDRRGRREEGWSRSLMQIQFTIGFPKVRAPRVGWLHLVLLLLSCVYSILGGGARRSSPGVGGGEGDRCGGSGASPRCLLLPLIPLRCVGRVLLHSVCDLDSLHLLHLGHIQWCPANMQDCNSLHHFTLYCMKILYFLYIL